MLPFKNRVVCGILLVLFLFLFPPPPSPNVGNSRHSIALHLRGQAVFRASILVDHSCIDLKENRPAEWSLFLCGYIWILFFFFFSLSEARILLVPTWLIYACVSFFIISFPAGHLKNVCPQPWNHLSLWDCWNTPLGCRVCPWGLKVQSQHNCLRRQAAPLQKNDVPLFYYLWMIVK